MYKKDMNMVEKALQHEKYIDSIEKMLPAVTSELVFRDLFDIPSDDYDLINDLFIKMVDNCRDKSFSDYGSTSVEVTNRTTIDEAIEQCNINGRVNTILNFADFKIPGGKYMEGSHAQEESLCHSTNMYRHLVSLDECYYMENRYSGCTSQGVYSSSSILLRNVSIVKDSNGEVKLGDTSGLTFCAVDVVVTAMPNYKAYKRVTRVGSKPEGLKLYLNCLFYRVGQILGCCEKLGNKTIILGACGCGAFGNRPEWVAQSFNYWLTHEFRGVFEKVIFAVPESGFKAGSNNAVFKQILL